jgi:hypothetical protein
MINLILTVVLYVLLIFLVLLIIAWIFNLLLFIYQNKFNIFSPKIYIKEIPFLINKNAIYRVRTAGQFLGLILFCATIVFIFLVNLMPFGVTVKYSLDRDHDIFTQLEPNNRVVKFTQNGKTIYKQISDYIYFNTKLPYNFDTATIKLYFRNSDPEQTISLGYQNNKDWQFETKPYDVPFINDTNWTRNGYNPSLYQRIYSYPSVTAFLQNIPKNALIGTFEYDTEIDNINKDSVLSYYPKKQSTIINTPLRGPQTIYVYLENEPFEMKIYKQDLNWYNDTDSVDVKVFKDKDLVYQGSIDDDGILDDSKKTLPPQELVIKTNQKELPENGIYKIVINANSDTIIKKIETNLHKIVFANSIFPVSNKNVYPNIVSSTSATTVYTNALSLSAQTNHIPGIQNILVGDQVLGVQGIHSLNYLPPKNNISKVVIPKNDVSLNAILGYFAFSPDQFFIPTKYNLIQISKPEDVKLVDYILTDYIPSYRESDWQVNEQTFDISTAYIKDNQLNWIIRAPHLKDRNGVIDIGNIQITFHKKGWLQ